MNAIRELYLNAGLITEDGYVKVRDGLWIASGPYKEQAWHYTDKSILPSKEELHEIYLKLQELIRTQETCGLPSFQQILDDSYPWVWSSIEDGGSRAWIQRMSDDTQFDGYKSSFYWLVPIRRLP